ncbi:uncharacterized oxidoreductase ygbj [Phtheirospermum japonicum]|uniref:Uncharacterized oxidoreductase ygbj n=1 Tax=Phtheirospermum japonicum TaxID=374723 RepID=A0A830BE36_9LAMI|nr:uncharacterized oxidoreductase ygbj [Phtheirospermum japonicum]
MGQRAVGFVGLDQVSLELAASLLRSGYAVQAFETSSQLMDDFSALGGKKCANLIETGNGVNALVTLVSHVDQIEDMFYGDEGVLKEEYKMDVVDMYVLMAVSEASNGSFMGVVLEMAKSLIFPLPLLTVAHQQILAGSHGAKDDDVDTPLLKVWERLSGVKILEADDEKTYNPEELANQLSTKSKTVKRIGFIGLGAMGFGMATHLLKSNFSVLGYDVYKPTLSRFENEGGIAGSNPADVSKDVDVLVIMVTNEYQAESVLFGDNGAVAALPSGASLILSSTVSPAFVSQLERRLQNEQKNLKLVDAPVSGGVKRAADGTLTMMASGADEALEHAGSVLSALSEKLYIINGGCGAGSCVKMINQLLAGVHIASAAEAIAFGARLGLNTRFLFDVITHSGGTSWMFENRGPHMIENDYTPLSALDIFVKDLGIVSRESVSRRVPLHVSNVAHQLFLSGV